MTTYLTATELHALPVHDAVQCSTSSGRVFLALKIDQGTGRHNPDRWNTTDGPATTTNVAAHNPRRLELAANAAEDEPSDEALGRLLGAVDAYRATREDVARLLAARANPDVTDFETFWDLVLTEARREDYRETADAVLAVLPAPPARKIFYCPMHGDLLALGEGRSARCREAAPGHEFSALPAPPVVDETELAARADALAARAMPLAGAEGAALRSMYRGGYLQGFLQGAAR